MINKNQIKDDFVSFSLCHFVIGLKGRYGISNSGTKYLNMFVQVWVCWTKLVPLGAGYMSQYSNAFVDKIGLLPLCLVRTILLSAWIGSVKPILSLIQILLPDPGVSGDRSMGPGVCLSVCHYKTFGWDFADVTNSILTDDANMANWSWRSSLRWWWSSKMVWRCPMWAMRSPRGSARWCKSCRECWSCDHVGDNIGCWAIGYRVGDDCHWDGGGRVGRQGGVQGWKGGHQGMDRG